MSVTKFNGKMNRHTLTLTGADSEDFSIGDAFNAVITVAQISGGSVATSILGNAAYPLRVSAAVESYICKAPNFTITLNSGSALVYVDLKRIPRIT